MWVIRDERFCWNWSEEFETKEEAINVGKILRKEAIKAGRMFYLDGLCIGELIDYKPEIDVINEVIEKMNNNFYDESGDDYDWEEDKLNSSLINELEKDLEKTITNWMDRNNIHPNIRKLTNVEKIV